MAGTAAATRRNPWWGMNTSPESTVRIVGWAPPSAGRSGGRCPPDGVNGSLAAARGLRRLPQVRPDVAGVIRPGHELHQRPLVRLHRRLVLPDLLLGRPEFL